VVRWCLALWSWWWWWWGGAHKIVLGVGLHPVARVFSHPAGTAALSFLYWGSAQPAPLLSLCVCLSSSLPLPPPAPFWPLPSAAHLVV